MELLRFGMARDDFWVFAGLSAFLALISLIFPMAPVGRALGFITGVAWLIIVSIALRRFRRRALWLLLGAPLALAWPCISVFAMLSCLLGDCT